jgi:O-antigen ligase
VVAFAAPRDVLATVKGLFTGAFLLMVTGIAAVLTAGSGTPLVGTARVTIDRVVAPVPRITGVLSSPNHLALVLVVGAFLSLLLGRTRLTRLAGFLVFLVAVPFTYSRGGILGAVAGVVTFVLLCLAFSPRTRRGAGTALLIGVFAVIFAVGVYAGLRWAVGQDVWNQRAVEIRERIAPLAFSTGLSHPVLGIGPGQFLSPAWFQVEAHDTYLQAFAEIGIVGLAGVSLLAVLALVTTIRTTMGSTTAESVRHGAALAAIVVAVTLQAATLTLTGLKVFWLVLALGLFYEADRTAGPAAGRPPGGVRVPAEHHST